MAKIEEIERRLLNWARWKTMRTGSCLGFSDVNLIAKLGTPRGSRYRESLIPTIACDAEETDRAVEELEVRLRDTVCVVYLLSGGMREKCRRLECSETTVRERIDQAHLVLQRRFADQAKRLHDERRRVENLQESARP